MDVATKKIWVSWAYASLVLLLITVPYAALIDNDEHWIWARNWSYVFISLAGIAKAIMDKVNFHFEKSVFNKRNIYYWNPEYSWINKYNKITDNSQEVFTRKKWFKIIPVPVLFTDFWHLVQTFHISLIMLAIVSYSEVYGFWVDFLIYSLLYRAFFFIFYNHYLARK